MSVMSCILYLYTLQHVEILFIVVNTVHLIDECWLQGERFLDLVKFEVWVNGETVEENANLVARLLIRPPECLGPALCGSGSEAASALANGKGAAAGKAASSESAASTLLTLQASQCCILIYS